MAKGKVVQVIGTVVDVEFPPDQIPALFNAIEVTSDGVKILLEAQQHVGNNWVRCLSFAPTECPSDAGASGDCSTSWASRWIALDR
jgi:F-type H+-transporting ATPase subunit beta